MKPPRWSERQRRLGRLSLEQLKRGHIKPYESASVDVDYLESLPPEARTWMANYLSEAHGGTFVPGERHVHTPALRRQAATLVRSHAGDRHPDVLTYPNGYSHVDIDACEPEALEAAGTPNAYAEDAIIAEVERRRRARWEAERAWELETLATGRSVIAALRRVIRRVKERR